MTGAVVIPPKAEAVARLVRTAAERRVEPAIGHPPAGARGCGTCGLPVPRSRLRCPSCDELRQVAHALAARTSLLAGRDDGRALAERMLVAALLLDLDRRTVEQLATVELVEAGLSAEVAALRFALSRVTSRRMTVAREPFGHLISPHLRAAGGAVLAPHDRRAAEDRMAHRPVPTSAPQRVETLRERLRAAHPLPDPVTPAERVRVSDTTGHAAPSIPAPTQPHRDRLGASAAETATTRR